MLKKVILGSLFMACVGCGSQSSGEVTPANPKIPTVGSEDWFFWVEKKVDTSDGLGHGPDYGSQEWCMVIDYRLFSSNSELTPCSALWNEKVTEKLK